MDMYVLPFYKAVDFKTFKKMSNINKFQYKSISLGVAIYLNTSVQVKRTVYEIIYFLNTTIYRKYRAYCYIMIFLSYRIIILKFQYRQTHAHAHAHTHTDTHRHTQTHKHTDTDTDTHTHTHPHTHTHMHSWMHTHKHRHIIHANLCSKWIKLCFCRTIKNA